MSAGALAALSADGGPTRQVDGSVVELGDDVETPALLLGPRDARPAPGGSYFDQWATGPELVYVEPDGSKSFISPGDTQWTDLPVNLVGYATANLPTAPEPGQVYYDTNRDIPTWWDGEAYEWPNYVDDVLTTAQPVSNTATPTTVWDPDIDTGSLVQGRIYQMDLHGVFQTANTSDQFTVDVNLAGTDVGELQNAPANVGAGTPWTFELTFTVRSHGQNGVLKANSRATFNEQPRTADHGEIAVNTTVANELSVSIDWDAADPDNSVTLEQAHLKQMG